MFTRQVLIGLLAAPVLLIAGCSSDKPTNLPTGPPLAPSSTPSVAPSAAAEQDALDAYRNMWDSFVEAAKTSDPEDPVLREYASGDALQLITGALYTNREQKQVILGELKINPRATSATPADAPTKVEIVDCVDDEDWLEYKKSGGLVDDKPGSKSRTTATVDRTATGWKVSRFKIGDQPC